MITSKPPARGRGALWLALLASIAGSFVAGLAWAQISGVSTPRPNLNGNIERLLRYRPDGGDFVIENGVERFSRSLYGGNTAFRVEGGDRPEFVLYLPGRGGNLRLGTGAVGSSRDRPELIAAFGGVNGERGVRDGDIGTEKVPTSEWFRLRPEFCRDNRITVSNGSFELRSAVANIAGVLPEGSRVTLAEARSWDDLEALLAHPSAAPGEPVAVARVRLEAGKPSYLALQRAPGCGCRGVAARARRGSGALSRAPGAGAGAHARSVRRRGGRRPQRRGRRPLGRAATGAHARRDRLAHGLARMARRLCDGRARLARPGARSLSPR